MVRARRDDGGRGGVGRREPDPRGLGPHGAGDQRVAPARRTLRVPRPRPGSSGAVGCRTPAPRPGLEPRPVGEAGSVPPSSSLARLRTLGVVAAACSEGCPGTGARVAVELGTDRLIARQAGESADAAERGSQRRGCTSPNSSKSASAWPRAAQRRRSAVGARSGNSPFVTRAEADCLSPQLTLLDYGQPGGWHVVRRCVADDAVPDWFADVLELRPRGGSGTTRTDRLWSHSALVVWAAPQRDAMRIRSAEFERSPETRACMRGDNEAAVRSPDIRKSRTP